MKPFLLAALLALASPLAAHEYEAGDLVVGHPYALATAPSAKTGAGYLTVTNEGDAPDRLVAVETAFPMTMLHATEVDAAGTARMVHLDGVDIPAGATVTLAPGGVHVMFMGLTGPLEAGRAFPATLVFEKAGPVPVEFKVEARDAADGAPDAHADH